MELAEKLIDEFTIDIDVAEICTTFLSDFILYTLGKGVIKPSTGYDRSNLIGYIGEYIAFKHAITKLCRDRTYVIDYRTELHPLYPPRLWVVKDSSIQQVIIPDHRYRSHIQTNAKALYVPIYLHKNLSKDINRLLNYINIESLKAKVEENLKILSPPDELLKLMHSIYGFDVACVRVQKKHITKELKINIFLCSGRNIESCILFKQLKFHVMMPAATIEKLKLIEIKCSSRSAAKALNEAKRDIKRKLTVICTTSSSPLAWRDHGNLILKKVEKKNYTILILVDSSLNKAHVLTYELSVR